VPRLLTFLRTRLAEAGDSGRRRAPLLRRVPPLHDLLEMTARFGYGARGFVYLSVGAIALLAAMDRVGDAMGSRGAVAWLAEQPFGRTWLILLGAGLWAFVVWRVLQSVFDADREGTDRRALLSRAGAGLSALFYGVLAASVFEFLDEVEADPAAEDVAENQEKAATLLALPFGDLVLFGVGLMILAFAVGNVVRGLRSDFGAALACSADMCRRVVPIARAGYIARGAALMPLAVFVILAGAQSRASQVASFGAGLDAIERQPGGSVVLGVTALGLMAFGAFAFVEARWRRIRPPRDLNPMA
jgi:hypothetical protein